MGKITVEVKINTFGTMKHPIKESEAQKQRPHELL